MKGQDYDIETASMRAAANRAAKAIGKKMRTRLHQNGETEGLVIQAFE
jgi:hypothetical protein